MSRRETIARRGRDRVTCADRGAAMSTLATTFRPAHPPGPALPPRHTPPSPQEQYHDRDRPITSATEELPITVRPSRSPVATTA